MSVYHVYTKTSHIPTFVLYQCQRCKSITSTVGSYDVSTVYSDRGATKKRLAQRVEEADADLQMQREAQIKYLQRAVTKVYDDYDKIKCKCPKCGHLSLSRISSPDRTAFYISIACAAVLLIYLIVSELSSPSGGSVGTIIGALVGSFFFAGLLSTFLSWIFTKITKAQMAVLCKQYPPLICSDRNQLIQEAKTMPAYKNADFSTIMNYPAVLNTNTQQQ